jgi:hypothetical protein
LDAELSLNYKKPHDDLLLNREGKTGFNQALTLAAASLSTIKLSNLIPSKIGCMPNRITMSPPATKDRSLAFSESYPWFVLFLVMTEFRLDRTAFKAQTFAEAANHSEEYKRTTWQERLRVAAWLIAAAYGFDPENPPKMDRTKFSARSMR